MQRNRTGAARRQDSTGKLALQLLYVALLSALLTSLVYQIPTTHRVDIGGYDAAYTRGFFDPQLSGSELAGSDGSARWTKAESFLLFPQAGWPAQISLHIRARPDSTSQLQILINGVEQLSMALDGSWQEIRLPVPVSLLKPEDTLITIRSSTGRLPGQTQEVGILIDQAVYAAGPAPILPAPSQLLYAVILSMLLWFGVRGSGPGGWARSIQHSTFNIQDVIVAALPALLLLVFYRIQTPYPYPLRGLLQTLCVLVAAVLAVRHAPRLAQHAAWLPDALALAGILVWCGALWNAAQGHVVRSVPGVENDFRVFATRSDLASIFRADGFYNLGYPLLLWLAGPFSAHNPFLAGRLVGLLAALVLLLATWWLGRVWLGRGAALIALMTVALSPLFVQYALYLGSDMPFAAVCMLTLALLGSGVWGLGFRAGGQESGGGGQGSGVGGRLFADRIGMRWLALTPRPPLPRAGEGMGERGETAQAKKPTYVRDKNPESRRLSIIAAGICAGLAFLIRHPGLVLLPVGIVAILLASQQSKARKEQAAQLSAIGYRLSAIFTLAFFLTITPQLIINLRDTGQPLYSQQAKNIWLAVMGDGDWGRWDEISNDIGLLDVFRQNPERFLSNWWTNLRGFVGSGAEDTSEFGRAIQLRLLGFPANWLALGGLLLWVGEVVRAYFARSQHRASLPTISAPMPEHALPTQTHLAQAHDLAQTQDIALSTQTQLAQTHDLAQTQQLAQTQDIALSTQTHLAQAHDLAQTQDIALSTQTHLAQTQLTQTHDLAQTQQLAQTQDIASLQMLWLVLYVLAICVGFGLPRFFLPLVAVYALAAASMLRWLAGFVKSWHPAQTLTALGLLLLACLWGGFEIGTSYVLRPRAAGEQLPGQAVDARAAVELVARALPNDELLVVRVPAEDDEGVALSKYSAIAHRVVAADGEPADWYARGARAVLWSQRLGNAPDLGRPLGQAGPYVLYRLEGGQ